MEVLQISKIAVCWDMFLCDVPITHIASQLQINRDTAHRWIREIKGIGSLEEYTDHYLNAKKGKRVKRKIDPLLKRRIWRIREENKGCCGQKIQYFLKKDYSTKVSVTTIYKVLSEKLTTPSVE